MKLRKAILKMLFIGGIFFLMSSSVQAFTIMDMEDKFNDIDDRYDMYFGKFGALDNFKPEIKEDKEVVIGKPDEDEEESGSGSSSGGSGSGVGIGSGSSSGGGRYSYTSFEDLYNGDPSGIYKDENGNFWISEDYYVQFVDNRTMEVSEKFYIYVKMWDGGKDAIKRNTTDYKYSSHKYRDMYLYNASDGISHDELQSNLFLDKQPFPFFYEYDEEGTLKKKMNLFTFSEYMYWGISSTGVVEIESYEQISEVSAAHDFEDFSAVSDPNNWDIMFKVGRNLYNEVGSSYDKYGYPFSRSKIQSLSGQAIKNGGTPFRNLKVIAQFLGIDCLKTQKIWDKSLGVDSSARMMFSTNDVIEAMLKKTESVVINENSNYSDLFSLASLGVPTNEYHSMFLSVEGQNATPRWVWSASPSVQGSFTNSMNFGRDVTPDSTFNLESYLKRWNGGDYFQNSNTSVFPDSSNQAYKGQIKCNNYIKNGIKTYIITCQMYPEFMNEAFRRGVGTSYAKSIEELNTLAESDYSSWYSCVQQQTDWFFENFAVSNFAVAGNSYSVAIARNSTYYASVVVARSLPIEVEVVTPISDLLISNTKNKAEKFNMLNTISWSTNDLVNSYGLPTNGWDITSYVYGEPVGLDENNTIDANYSGTLNKFATSLYVARTPNLLGITEEERGIVKFSDINVVATAEFNKNEFNPDEDVNKDGKENLKQVSGTAEDTLKNAFDMFYTDYNSTFLSKTFNKGSDSRVFAQPVRYKVPEGEVINFTGTEEIPMSEWKQVSSLEEEVPVGSIIEYKLDYDLPSSDSVKNSMLGDYTMSLYKRGSWWEGYQTVLNANLTFDILPKTDEGKTQNIFTENDYTRMRIVKPNLRDMYITRVEIYRGDSATPIITRTAGNSETGFCTLNSQGQRIEKIVIPRSIIKELQVNQNTGQYLTDLYVRTYYNYYGKNDVLPIGEWAKLKVNNGFTNVETEVSANAINGFTAVNDGSLTSSMRIDLNKVVLNENKDKMLTISVPIGDNNECRRDWEIVNIVIENESTNKDNEIVDIQLVDGSLINEFGDTSIYRGGNEKSVAQVIPASVGASTNCYVVVTVRRLQPTDIAWDESRKDGTLDGTLCINYEKNGTHYTEMLSAPNLIGSYRWGEGKNLGYSKSNPNCFSKAGDIMYYKFNVGTDVKSLNVTAYYRTGKYIPSASIDEEDYSLINNTWTEIWESEKNPNFVLDIVAGQQNVQKTMKVSANSQCPSEPEAIYPWLEFQISQENPNAKGTWNPRVHVTMNGVVPKEVSGISYMGNGIGTATFSTGDTAPRTVYASFDKLNVYWGVNSSKNRTYTMKPHINYSCCKNVPNEITDQDNYKEYRFTTNLNCQVVPNAVTPACCIFDKRINQDAKMFYGAGQRYEWDTQFKWSQQNTYQDEAINVKPREHDPACDCVSVYEDVENADGTTSKVLIEYRTHTHCYCYCTVTHEGPNNNKIYWRSKDIGYSPYYEEFNMHIYVWSSAHGTRDIAGGSTVIYTGETFKFWFETTYNSNRDDLPISKHEPFAQPYSTGQGGEGCFPCNILSRWPSTIEDIAGPNKVDLKISGTQNYDMEYYGISPQYVRQNEPVNKKYQWIPVPDEIFVPETNMLQQIQLYLCVYDFKGYVSDTGVFDGGSSPGYAWYKRDTHAYCDAKTGNIYIRPSKIYISSGQEREGLDGQGTLDNGSGGDNFIDGDIWVY